MAISHDARTIIIGTCIFWGLAILTLPFSLCLGKNNGGLLRITALTTAACMWLMWLMIYLHQMNPLIKPQRQLEGKNLIF
jgi:hypothetical protein